MMKFASIGLSFAAAAAILSGCGQATTTRPVATAVAVPAVSWDGTYRGTIQITGVGSGVQRPWCQTDPQMVVQVTNNAFRYAMPHPNAPDNPTPVYAATIGPDGIFKSQIGSGTMSGRVDGTRITGAIDGSVCVYAFSMDRS